MAAETDWENCYLRGETPWDKGAPSPGLLRYLQEQSITGRVLVPGCGLGHDVRALAARGAQVVGLDVSPSAVDRARAFDRTGDELYRLGDFFELDEDLRGAFDWVWEHTCFCAIEPDQRKAYVRAVSHALSAEGKLLAVFYLDPYDDSHRPGGGPPHGATVKEIEELFGKRFEFLSSWVPEAAYVGREGREWMSLMRRI